MHVIVLLNWFTHVKCTTYETCAILHRFHIVFNSYSGDKKIQYCTCPAGQVTYNFHSSCKHVHLSLKRVCNKEHKGVICNMTSSSNSSQSTRPVGKVLWKELLILSRFHL